MKRLAVLLLLVVACGKAKEAAQPPQPAAQPSATQTSAATPDRGRQLIAQYGCNVCHAIPGIDGPQGSLAPPLAHVAARPAISNGKVQNTPENLARFIQNPPSMNPTSGMPPLAIPDADARAIVGYLETLR
jgi:mono/diheme cytochrome c family protein